MLHIRLNTCTYHVGMSIDSDIREGFTYEYISCRILAEQIEYVFTYSTCFSIWAIRQWQDAHKDNV